MNKEYDFPHFRRICVPNKAIYSWPASSYPDKFLIMCYIYNARVDNLYKRNKQTNEQAGTEH